MSSKETDAEQALLKMESPFTWKLPEMDQTHGAFIESLEEKTLNYDEQEDETEFKWNSYVLHTLLAYELCRKKKDFTKAAEHASFCVDHLHDLTKQQCTEMMFTSIQGALWHVALATKAYVLLKKGETEKVDDVISEVKPILEMSPKEKAGINGVKAAVFIRYGREGQRQALELAKTAKSLDSRQAEWSFLVGKALGRLRRAEYRKITDEEISAIQHAYECQKSASNTVYLAQLYSDYAKQLFFGTQRFNRRGCIEESKFFSKKSVQLYKKALEIRPNCATLKARVAHGWLRIKDKEALDIPYIKKLLDEVVKASPNNSMAYHDLGTYYEKFQNATDRAIFNLQKAVELGNSKALLYMTTVKWNHGLRHQIISDLQKAVNQFTEVATRAELLMCLGAAYLLIENDWPAGVEQLTKSLELDPSAKYFLDYMGFRGGKVNLLELVTDELRFKTDAGKKEPAFQAFLELAKIAKPEMFNSFPQSRTFEAWRDDQLRESYRRR